MKKKYPKMQPPPTLNAWKTQLQQTRSNAGKLRILITSEISPSRYAMAQKERGTYLVFPRTNQNYRTAREFFFLKIESDISKKQERKQPDRSFPTQRSWKTLPKSYEITDGGKLLLATLFYTWMIHRLNKNLQYYKNNRAHIAPQSLL